MESETLKKQHCLSGETLNLVIDGLYELSPEELAHLQSCEGCRLRYEELKQVDQLLSQSWSIPMDKFDPEAIRRNVANAIAKDNRQRLVLHRKWVAAAASIVLVLGSLVALNPNNSFDFVAPAQDSDSVNIADNSNNAIQYPYQASKPYDVSLNQVQSGPQSVSLQIDKLVPIELTGHNSFMAYLKDAIGVATNSLYDIPDMVEQVWAVDNIEVAAMQLDNMLEILNLNNGQVVWGYNSQGGLTVECDITQGELMQILRNAELLNWDLLTALGPQPENTILPSREFVPVTYTMRIVGTE